MLAPAGPHGVRTHGDLPGHAREDRAHGDDLVIVASKGGHHRHPGWFHNLRASPDTTVELPGGKRPVHARQAGRDERARLWPKAVASYPPYEAYQRRTSREIPIVVLEPRS